MAGMLLVAVQIEIRAQPEPPNTTTINQSAAITPAAILSLMQRVADWQLAHPSIHKPTDWTRAQATPA